jgi:hypothetical protein
LLFLQWTPLIHYDTKERAALKERYMAKLKITETDRRIVEVEVKIVYEEGPEERQKLDGPPFSVSIEGKVERMAVLGDVYGEVDAEADLECNDIKGNVSAGKDLTGGNIIGSITVGGDVNCDNVRGDVNAGGDVNCTEIRGPVAAAGEVNADDFEDGDDEDDEYDDYDDDYDEDYE